MDRRDVEPTVRMDRRDLQQGERVGAHHSGTAVAGPDAPEPHRDLDSRTPFRRRARARLHRKPAAQARRLIAMSSAPQSRQLSSSAPPVSPTVDPHIWHGAHDQTKTG